MRTPPDLSEVRRRGLVCGWRAFWFHERPLLDLAIARVLVAAFLLYLDRDGRVLRVAMVDPAHWQPIALLRVLLPDPPGVGLLAAVDHATRAALGAALVGFATNASLLLAFVLQLFQEACGNSLGKTTHATLPILYALLFLSLAPCGRVLSVDAAIRGWWARRNDRPVDVARPSGLAAWPFELLFLELAVFYFQAGYAKLRTSGLAWADGYTLQFYLLDKGEPAGLWLAGHLGLCAVFSVAVLAFELGFPLAVVVRRWRPLFLCGGFVFHLATAVFLGISFWPVWALYLLFVPWTALIGRLRGREDGEPERPIPWRWSRFRASP